MVKFEAGTLLENERGTITYEKLPDNTWRLTADDPAMREPYVQILVSENWDDRLATDVWEGRLHELETGKVGGDSGPYGEDFYLER